MGAASSDFDRAHLAQVGWSLPHQGSSNAWSNYVVSRYGNGYSVTGIAASLALPRLLRKRLQDWRVDSFGFYFSKDFISFGRNLRSLSREGSNMFYGVDIRLGHHTNSWFCCKPTEWLLRLHKAILEPFSNIDASAQSLQDRRFPGRAYYIGNEPPPAAVAANRATGEAAKLAESSKGGDDKEEKSCESQDASAPTAFTHQLSVFLGNADGQIGLLTLPVPGNQVQALEGVLEAWEGLEVPCSRAGQTWRSTEDFLRFREQTVNLQDLLLLVLEPEMAMSLTPDWTWEKYPRGCGEVAVPTATGPEDAEGLQ
mmetsp:Transcript_26542/g.63313  ORF Transcript_26542/g.63313 Transcript_26542/m.63313 type:complete len:312 (-) Transcript_26542:66-1001(-)|eukprot:CAMPEP_0181450604 /NCGR_PEP_ID=MMETSP1110-20121109/28261_1 /TAXON_ID=174948 /ORGANISM="Symbiodinium sp., Strain CCMP421" /LENGTH=311 /DNA_ID=CAMNT_0023574829 /DNA_START=81 /DNA_END=1016 /DNA_ORIENTATION=+